MSEEQAGTASAVEGAPATTAPVQAVESQTAQPQAQAPVESAKPEAPQSTGPNWDDPANPWRARYDGIQGNFKQEKALREQHETRLRQLETERNAEREQRRLESAQAQEAAKRQRLKSLIEQDDGPVSQELKADLARQEAYEAWQREHLPRVQQQAWETVNQQVYGQYEAGVRRAYEAQGLTQAEIDAVAQEVRAEGKSFDDFVARVATRTVEKKTGSLEDTIKARVAEAQKATEARLRAEFRGSERSPDLSGSVPTGDELTQAEFNANRGNLEWRKVNLARMQKAVERGLVR